MVHRGKYCPECQSVCTASVRTLIGALAAAFVLAASACSQTCPPGTTLVGGPPPKALSQFCSGSHTTIAHLRAGGNYEDVLGIAFPTARGDVVDGPATEWYPDGTIKSHGGFTIVEGRSVPDGVWTFWYPSGERKIQGRYADGVPVGCFGVWDAAGAVRTFVPVEGTFKSSGCTIVLDRNASQLAARYGGPAYDEPADTSLGGETFSAAIEVGTSPNDLPLSADELTQPDVPIQQDLRVSLRRRVSWLKVGAVAGVTITDRRDDWRASLGGLASVSIPTGVDRIDVELSTEVGSRLYSALPRMNEFNAIHSERFFVPYGGAQAAFGVRLTDELGLYTVLHAEADISRTTERSSKWCGTFACGTSDATWHVGGTALAAALQLRFLVD